MYVYLAVLDKLGLISINEHCSKLSIDFFSQLQMTYRASVLSLNTKKWLFVANKSTKWRANFRFDWPKWPEFHWLRSNWVDKSQKGLVLLLQLLLRVCCWLFSLLWKTQILFLDKAKWIANINSTYNRLRRISSASSYALPSRIVYIFHKSTAILAILLLSYYLLLYCLTFNKENYF